MRVDRQLVAVGKFGKGREQLLAAAFRARRTERPGDARMRSAPRLDEIAHQGWKIDILEWLDGAGKRPPLIRGDHFVPEGIDLTPGTSTT